jgi:hypothetical protein
VPKQALYAPRVAPKPALARGAICTPFAFTLTRIAPKPALARGAICTPFAFTLTATRDGLEVYYEFVARLRLDGAPEGRHEAVIAELLSDPERRFAFLLLLLSSDDRDSEEAMDRPEGWRLPAAPTAPA